MTEKPSKPAVARESSGTEQTSSRRSLLGTLWLLLGAALSAEALWITLSFLRPRKDSTQSDDQNWLVIAGPVDRFAPGTVTAFQRGRFYLARLADGGFLALSRTCTHLGCTVPWVEAESRFVCPCHASSFDIAGQVLSPPAPRPLDLFPVRIENGIVKVDTRQARARRAFAPDQVARPS